MMFNNVEQYIARADGVWIVQIIKRNGTQSRIGRTFEAKVMQTLKGDVMKDALTICALSKELVPRERYLVFGFNHHANGVWTDNGNISPVPVSDSFSLESLKGKTVKKQVLDVLSARRKALDWFVQAGKEEMELLDKALSSENSPKPSGSRALKGSVEDLDFSILDAPCPDDELPAMAKLLQSIENLQQQNSQLRLQIEKLSSEKESLGKENSSLVEENAKLLSRERAYVTALCIYSSILVMGILLWAFKRSWTKP